MAIIYLYYVNLWEWNLNKNYILVSLPGSFSFQKFVITEVHVCTCVKIIQHVYYKKNFVWVCLTICKYCVHQISIIMYDVYIYVCFLVHMHMDEWEMVKFSLVSSVGV